MSSTEGITNNEVSVDEIIVENDMNQLTDKDATEVRDSDTDELSAVAKMIMKLKQKNVLVSPPTGSPPTIISEQEMSPSKEELSEASPNGRTRHASIDIYRPPSLRSGDGTSQIWMKSSKLNVHAREFVMGNEKKANKSDDDCKDSHVDKSSSSQRKDAGPFIYPLNISKSSVAVFDNSRFTPSQFRSNERSKDHSFDLQRVKSSGSVGLSLENHRIGAKVSKVQFKPTMNCEKGDFHLAEEASPPKKLVSESFNGNLKRSKSLNANDQSKFEASLTRSFTQYDSFPGKLHNVIRQAVENADHMEDKSKIALGRKIVESAVEDKELASVSAKLSIIIMNKDKTGAYYDSLLNTCQMFYQTKKISSVSNPTNFVAFLGFLQEFYSELKRRAMQLKILDSVAVPELTFLMLIARCCVDMVASSSTLSVAEIECLFAALTKVGRDIENEVPKLFKKLFDTIREVLLTGRSSPEVRKVLLQLIELRAFEWQLPLSALNFYYPKVVA